MSAFKQHRFIANRQHMLHAGLKLIKVIKLHEVLKMHFIGDVVGASVFFFLAFQ